MLHRLIQLLPLSKVDRGDEEEAQQHSSSAERNTEAFDNDFDGLNIEDWLAKHHNEQASEQQSHRGVTIEKTAPTKERRAPAPAEPGFAGRPVSHKDEDVNITAQSIEDGSSKRQETASAQRTHHGKRETREEQGRLGDNDESIEGFEDNDIIMEASIHLVNNNDSNNDFTLRNWRPLLRMIKRCWSKELILSIPGSDGSSSLWVSLCFFPLYLQ
jgi:hypothetical protein